MILAMLFACAQGKGLPAAAKDYLVSALGTGTHFPSPPNVETLLGGLGTEEQVLVAIDKSTRTAPPPTSGGNVAGNVDPDKKGTNSEHITTRVFSARVDNKTEVHEKPDLASAVIATLNPGDIAKVDGETDDKKLWAVEVASGGGMKLGYAAKGGMYDPDLGF
jgi:hypothetical protein